MLSRGLSPTGFHPEPDYIRFFVSTGTEEVRGGGAAEYLKSSPDVVECCFRALGRVTPPGKYLVVRACETIPDTDPGIRSICFFGTAEQIRFMAALVHFDRDDPFSPVMVPWGQSCSTFITYPAWTAENAPKETAFMGPQDPYQNKELPSGYDGDMDPRRDGGTDGRETGFVVYYPEAAARISQT